MELTAVDGESHVLLKAQSRDSLFREPVVMSYKYLGDDVYRLGYEKDVMPRHRFQANARERVRTCRFVSIE